MTKANPESVATRDFRRLLECRGAFTKKLSDAYTRGIPDLLVSVSFVVMIEMKIDHGVRGDLASYKTLGMSGAQDENVRQLCRRNIKSACCVTAIVKDEQACKLWTPVAPGRSGEPFVWYQLQAKGFPEVFEWLKNASLT